MQSPRLYGEPKEYRSSNHPFPGVGGLRVERFRDALEQGLGYVWRRRMAVLIATLSLLSVWQWHVAALATQRADMAERDMELNGRQAIKLSEAVLKAEAAHDRLERSISGYALPPAK